MTGVLWVTRPYAEAGWSVTTGGSQPGRVNTYRLILAPRVCAKAAAYSSVRQQVIGNCGSSASERTNTPRARSHTQHPRSPRLRVRSAKPTAQPTDCLVTALGGLGDDIGQRAGRPRSGHLRGRFALVELGMKSAFGARRIGPLPGSEPTPYTS